MTQKHTPLPWHIRPPQSNFAKDRYTIHPYLVNDAGIEFPAFADHDKIIAMVGGKGTNHGDTSRNAAFIVRAVNSHYELLEAVAMSESYYDSLITSLEKYPDSELAKSQKKVFIEAREKIRRIISKTKGEA